MESLAFLILKRNLLHVHQVKAFKARGGLATKQVVWLELVQHRTNESKIRHFKQFIQLRLLQRCLVAVELHKNTKVKCRQQSKFAMAYRDFKLKQLAVRSLRLHCNPYGCFSDGRVNQRVVIPSDFEIAQVLQNASDYRHQKV